MYHKLIHLNTWVITIQNNVDISVDVTHRISTGWLRWRAVTGVLCNKSVHLKLKGKFYRVAIIPSLLYGSECWPLKKVQERRLETAEMHMQRSYRRYYMVLSAGH